MQDKENIRAEIERRIYKNKRNKEFENVPEKRHQLIIEGQLLGELKHFIDSMQEEPVSEDLEKEIDKYISSNFFGSQTMGFFANRTKENPNDQDIALCAKHFFELGMAASNPITAADKGIAEVIIINLKRVEKDYRIDLTKEIMWVRNKVQKGEKI